MVKKGGNKSLNYLVMATSVNQAKLWLKLTIGFCTF